MSNPFATPGSASGIAWEDLNGALLLISPTKQEFGVTTSFGDKDPIRADVAVLDGPQKGTEYTDTLVFPNVLIGQLKGRIGQKVLGRLAQGQAKPGQKPPWRLEEASDEDTKVGMAYLSGQIAAPAAASSGATPPF